MAKPGDVTELLLAYNRGERDALDQLLPLLYDQLKRLARARLRGERPDHTLNTTALVHEAYLRLVDAGAVDWQDRAHFLAVASRAMRRILIDYARRRAAGKRGGDMQRVAFEESLLISPGYAESLIDLEDGLEKLEEARPRACRAVELHYFSGLTLEEVGAVLGVSAPTVMRDLRFAQAWLARVWTTSA